MCTEYKWKYMGCADKHGGKPVVESHLKKAAACVGASKCLEPGGKPKVIEERKSGCCHKHAPGK